MLLVVGLFSATATAEVKLPQPDETQPITITAQESSHWPQGGYEVWVLRGNVTIVQGSSSARSQEGVLWLDRNSELDGGRNKVIAYLEGEVQLDFQQNGTRSTRTDKTWLGRFLSVAPIAVHPQHVSAAPDQPPPIFQRGMACRAPASQDAIHRTEYQQPLTLPGTTAVNQPAAAAATRRVRIDARGDVPVHIEWRHDPQTNQSIGTITNGVTLVVDGLPNLGAIDVSADRMVIWTYGIEGFLQNQETLQAATVPLEVYMEGNIVFRQGEGTIHADRMYYDVPNRVGMVLNAELRTPVPNYDGWVRLQAQVLEQSGEGRYFAQNAFVTSSLLGQPTYRLQSENLYFEDIQQPVLDAVTGLPQVDPVTQEPLVHHQQLATAQNNFVYLDEVPVFYWPIIATDLTRPTFFLRRFQVRSDGVFGQQLLTTWDAYQMLGIRNHPPGTDWDVSLDYMSKRGLGHGTTYTYLGDDFFGIPGPTAGLFDYWGINDKGRDNLGLDRRSIEPPKEYRYRLLWQHREMLCDDYELLADVHWMSDRYFLQEYFEREWEGLTEQRTGLELRRAYDNISWNVQASVRIDNFFTQTEWLPRLDHFWLGQPLLNDTLTWYEHSSLGYAHLRPATPPENPIQDPFFTLLPWERDVQGERFVTRQELDWPFQLGALKIVPYALGEAGHWGGDLEGNDIQRLYGQAGVRADLPMYRVYPEVESGLWNVHGLAHKINFNGEFFIAEANQNLDQFPLYDQIDNEWINTFRHRYADYTFGGTIPARFDERFYAVRSGLASWVSSPSFEIAEDLALLRLGAEQRWQTKRGLPEDRHIVDWITLDTNINLYPDPDRDNFGEIAGLADYDFRWFVGDRLTLTSDGMFDFFSEGQRMVNVGAFISRPPRGSLFLGVRLLDGPVNANVLSASYSYLMSPKWISTMGVSVDVGERNIGENFSITRIGESFLVSGGVTVDDSRGTVGAIFSIEPRFLPHGRLGRVAGARIPAAGALGLE